MAHIRKLFDIRMVVVVGGRGLGGGGASHRITSKISSSLMLKPPLTPHTVYKHPSFNTDIYITKQLALYRFL